jgi:uncharacterized membrane protein YagU involved in acid resistance
MIDGLFSSVLSVAFYHSTVAHLFQDVAGVLRGADAFIGGTPMVVLGVLMHFGVAFAWSMAFFLIARQASWIRTRLAAPGGVVMVSALYGPSIWMTMSLLVIPALTHRSPAITPRWWIQFFGHIPFVAMPIVGSFRRLGTL